jgi:hypothetical protein
VKKTVAVICGLALLGILLRAVGIDTNVIDRWALIVLAVIVSITFGEELAETNRLLRQIRDSLIEVQSAAEETRTATVMLCQDVNEIRAARNRL